MTHEPSMDRMRIAQGFFGSRILVECLEFRYYGTRSYLITPVHLAGSTSASDQFPSADQSSKQNGSPLWIEMPVLARWVQNFSILDLLRMPAQRRQTSTVQNLI